MGPHFTQIAKCLKLTKKSFEPMFHQVPYTPHLHMSLCRQKLSSMKSAFLYVPPTMREVASSVSGSEWSARMLYVCMSHQRGLKNRLLIGRRHPKVYVPPSDGFLKKDERRSRVVKSFLSV